MEGEEERREGEEARKEERKVRREESKKEKREWEERKGRGKRGESEMRGRLGGYTKTKNMSGWWKHKTTHSPTRHIPGG